LAYVAQYRTVAFKKDQSFQQRVGHACLIWTHEQSTLREHTFHGAPANTERSSEVAGCWRTSGRASVFLPSSSQLFVNLANHLGGWSHFHLRILVFGLLDSVKLLLLPRVSSSSAASGAITGLSALAAQTSVTDANDAAEPTVSSIRSKYCHCSPSSFFALCLTFVPQFQIISFLLHLAPVNLLLFWTSFMADATVSQISFFFFVDLAVWPVFSECLN